MQDRSPTADAAGLAAAAALLVLAAALHAALLDWQTSDALAWFVPWLDHIAAHGAVASLAAPLQVQVEGAGTPANYNPPYLYLLIAASAAHGMLESLTLVKLVSIAGTLLCAACLHALLRVHVGPQRALLGALGMLLLPTVALNAAAWGQTDAIWAGLAALAVAAALRERWPLMMLAFGAAVAFKLQAILIAPFILHMMLARRLPVALLGLAALAYALSLLPAWLAGRPALDLALVYLEQARTYQWLSMNAPNPWAFVQALRLVDYGTGSAIGLALATAAALALAGIALRRRLGRTELLLLAVVTAAAMPYLLPKMHDRYFFLADILAFALAVVRPLRWTIGVAVGIQLGSLGAYAAHLLDMPLARYPGALCLGLALAVATWQLLRALRQAPAAEGAGLALPWAGGWRTRDEAAG